MSNIDREQLFMLNRIRKAISQHATGEGTVFLGQDKDDPRLLFVKPPSEIGHYIYDWQYKDGEAFKSLATVYYDFLEKPEIHENEKISHSFSNQIGFANSASNGIWLPEGFYESINQSGTDERNCITQAEGSWVFPQTFVAKLLFNYNKMDSYKTTLFVEMVSDAIATFATGGVGYDHTDRFTAFVNDTYSYPNSDHINLNGNNKKVYPNYYSLVVKAEAQGSAIQLNAWVDNVKSQTNASPLFTMPNGNIAEIKLGIMDAITTISSMDTTPGARAYIRGYALWESNDALTEETIVFIGEGKENQLYATEGETYRCRVFSIKNNVRVEEFTTTEIEIPPATRRLQAESVRADEKKEKKKGKKKVKKGKNVADNAHNSTVDSIAKGVMEKGNTNSTTQSFWDYVPESLGGTPTNKTESVKEDKGQFLGGKPTKDTKKSKEE